MVVTEGREPRIFPRYNEHDSQIHSYRPVKFPYKFEIQAKVLQVGPGPKTKVLLRNKIDLPSFARSIHFASYYPITIPIIGILYTCNRLKYSQNSTGLIIQD